MNQMISAQATLAFTLANGFAIQIITLSVALIGLTVTFAKDFQQNNIPSRLFLIAIWVTFFVSIYSGIITIKALITVVDPQKTNPILFSDDSLSWATWQESSFFIGVGLFIIQGVVLIWSKRSQAAQSMSNPNHSP